jgi:NADH:ubiquinone oxidoreductase subunit 6 (subunit J)
MMILAVGYHMRARDKPANTSVPAVLGVLALIATIFSILVIALLPRRSQHRGLYLCRTAESPVDATGIGKVNISTYSLLFDLSVCGFSWALLAWWSCRRRGAVSAGSSPGLA